MTEGDPDNDSVFGGHALNAGTETARNCEAKSLLDCENKKESTAHALSSSPTPNRREKKANVISMGKDKVGFSRAALQSVV